ncbi:MAG: hypothetical protein IH905_14375 [Proteobacteria bacterium]|nr:hypothetical protein [Pseudomonadota bacterium]
MSASKLATGSRRSREVATMGDESELATLFEADGSTRTWRLPGYARKAINKAREKDRRFFENNPGVQWYERSYIPGEEAHEVYRRDGECPTHVLVALTNVGALRAYRRQPVH